MAFRSEAGTGLSVRRLTQTDHIKCNNMEPVRGLVRQVYSIYDTMSENVRQSY